MIVGVDANISPKVVRALQSLYMEHTFTRVGIGPAESDAPWIADFSQNCGDGLITLDKRILSRPHEVEALFQSQLLTCVFNFGKMTDFRMQASFIIEYWQYLDPIWSTANPPRVIKARPVRNRNKPTLESLEYYMQDEKPKLRSTKLLLLD